MKGEEEKPFGPGPTGDTFHKGKTEVASAAKKKKILPEPPSQSFSTSVEGGGDSTHLLPPHTPAQ